MKLLEEKEEKLLGKKTVTYSVEVNSATPSRASLQKDIATMHKVKPQLVVVKNIVTAYGTRNVTVTAEVFASESDYKAVVPESLKKKSVVEEPKVEEKEESAEEKPAEESQEEAPTETPKEESA
ncbi:MAG: hypothetical protein ACMXYK_05785 [Candidatus Woesearchaeota archaeon]